MPQKTDEELKKELKELEALCKKRLPFDSNFFEDGVENLPDTAMFGPISEHPQLLSAKGYLRWLESDKVQPTMNAWKKLVIDSMEMRKQLMNGFTTNEETASDTIDTMRLLCSQQSSHKGPSATDAWEATAFYAARLVNANKHEGSPICGMEAKGELDYCFVVMILLLIVVYTDMLRKQKGYFATLLGGSTVERMSMKEFERDMLKIVNKPISKPREMAGLHGYNRLHLDYSFFQDIGKGSGKTKK